MASCGFFDIMLDIDISERIRHGTSFLGRTYVVAADLSASNSVGSETSHCNLGICVKRVDGRERRESMDCCRVENRWRATKTET